MTRWYINGGGQIEGPIDETTFIARIRSGELDGGAYVCPDGGQTWGLLRDQAIWHAARRPEGAQATWSSSPVPLGGALPSPQPFGTYGSQPSSAGASSHGPFTPSPSAPSKTSPPPLLLLGGGCGVLAVIALCLGGSGIGLALSNDDDGDTTEEAEDERPPHATQISVGTVHSCARFSDGSAWCWGSNSMGQLGDGTLTHHPTDAVQVSGLDGVEEVIALNRSSCARLTEGTVYCWGDNAVSQLGNGTTVDSPTPVQVNELTGATALFGDGVIGAVLEDGSVAIWGSNMGGGHVPLLPERIATATRVPGVTDVTAVSLGPFSGFCPTDSRGNTTCSGNPPGGRLAFLGWPLGFTGYTGGAMRFSFDKACYVDEGRAACWGISDTFSSMNLPTPTGDRSPVPLPGTGYVDVIPIGAFENAAAIALKDDGTLSCLGTCSIGEGGHGYPLPTVTGVEEIDGHGGYLCLRGDTDVIRCLGQRIGEGEDAPPVWAGDLTEITFPAMASALEEP